MTTYSAPCIQKECRLDVPFQANDMLFHVLLED